MSRTLLLMFAALILAGLVLIPLFIPDAPSKPYYAGIQPPLVIAHQGGDGIWPGDTLYAFEKAVEVGADVLEMDAHITQDGKIVLMHDEEVDRTTDGTGLIEDMTLDELKHLDAAYQWRDKPAQENFAQQYEILYLCAGSRCCNLRACRTKVLHGFIMERRDHHFILHLMLPDQCTQQLIDRVLSELDLDYIPYLRKFLKKLIESGHFDTLAAIRECLAAIV